MNPNASLKSLNTNRLVMASRSLTSLQPASLASAVRRASPVSFWVISAPLLSLSSAVILPRIGSGVLLAMPIVSHYLPIDRSTTCEVSVHVLVPEYRLDRQHAGPRAHYLPLVTGLDLCCELRVGRRAGGLVQPRVLAAAVRLRAGARVRPHLRGACLRSGNARRDAAADRRAGAARAHSGGAIRGVPDRDRRSAGQRRDRDRARSACRREAKHG